VTLPTTITYCPGGNCNVHPTVTPPPQHGADYTSTILHVTFTGKDGKVTEIDETITVFPAPCANGPGMCGVTYTLTEECPCTEGAHGNMPADFTTTVHKCNQCGPGGSPTTITQTIPCETGAYASVTPSAGPWHGDYWNPPAGGNGGNGGYGGNGGPAGPGGNGGNGGPAGPGGHGGHGGHGGNGGPDGAAPGGTPAGNKGPGAGGAAPPAGAPGSGAPGAMGPGGAAPGGKAPGAGAGAAGANGAPGAGAGAAPSYKLPGAAAPTAGAGNGRLGDGNGVAPYTGAATRLAFAASSVGAAAVAALAFLL
jgi:hypothetical protein